MKITNNKRALESQEKITTSLLNLMKKYPFEEITVKEIIGDTDITRQSFYRNFKDKNEVLDTYLHKLYQQCFDDIMELNTHDIHKILNIYYGYWFNHKNLIQTIIKNNIDWSFHSYSYEYAKKLTPYIERTFNIKYSSDIEQEYIENYIIGGILQMKELWFKRNFNERPEKITELTLKLLNKKI